MTPEPTPPRGAPPLPRGVPGRVRSPAQRIEPDFRRFLLLEPATYLWWHPLDAPDAALHRLVVPPGFDHDFASVPRLLWFLISPFDLGLASIFHDYLYRHGGAVETGRWDPATAGWAPVDRPWNRERSDALFARIMREQGVARWRRRWAYRAVRLLGGGAWRGDGGSGPGRRGS